MCTTNKGHMMSGSWDIRHDEQSFLSFRVIFYCFTWQTLNIKIWTKYKKQLGILSFYTSDDEKFADEEWFEEVDEHVFTFKHKVYNWLKEAETEQSAKKTYSKKGSKSTSSGSSRKTKSSNSGGSSRFSKERAMEEKAKLAELMPEAKFMQQRQMAENWAEQLRVQEKLVKAKARSEVYEAMERKGSEVDKSEIIRGLLLDSRLYISIKWNLQL